METQPEAVAIVEAWLQAYGLKDKLRQAVRIAEVWVRHCSPPDASLKSRVTLLKDVALWLFYIDDYDCNREGYEAFLGQCLGILDGKAPDGSHEGVLYAYFDIVQDVRAASADMSRYLSSRKQYIHFIKDRNRPGRSFSFAEYLTLRRTTIYVYQWMDLFEILEDFRLPDGELLHPIMQQAVVSTVDANVFLNELFSVEKDTNAVPNLVRLLHRERGGSLDAASSEVSQKYDAAVASYTDAAQRLRSGPQSERMLRYLDYLGCTIAGGARAYQDARNRYQAQPRSAAAAKTVVSSGEPK